MDPFIGEIKIISFNFPPKGWALCNGQLLPINQNQALFSILGTTYGGNGQTTFALPNLSGRVPVHVGTQTGLGQAGGAEYHTLTAAEPTHLHQVNASANTADQIVPTNNFWASNTGATPYAASAVTVLSPSAIAVAGGSQPHENRPPFLVLNFIIALVGIFPPRN
jgi:microcystin-dependent protein